MSIGILLGIHVSTVIAVDVFDPLTTMQWANGMNMLWADGTAMQWS